MAILQMKFARNISTMRTSRPNALYFLLMTILFCIGTLSIGWAQTAGNEVAFTKFHLWDEFYTEGITVADINKDGKTDIIAGARWFEAPDWKVHDIWKHKK